MFNNNLNYGNGENGGKVVRQLLEKDLKVFTGSQEIIEQKISKTARMYFYKYKELKKSGFSSEEAIMLLCHRGLE